MKQEVVYCRAGETSPRHSWKLWLFASVSHCWLLIPALEIAEGDFPQRELGSNGNQPCEAVGGADGIHRPSHSLVLEYHY